jgi:hypothetical protein
MTYLAITADTFQNDSFSNPMSLPTIKVNIPLVLANTVVLPTLV